jgi:hypothetical protein
LLNFDLGVEKARDRFCEPTKCEKEGCKKTRPVKTSSKNDVNF